MWRHQILNLYIIDVTEEEFREKKIEGNFSVSSKGENSVMFRSVFCNNEYQKKKKKEQNLKRF